MSAYAFFFDLCHPILENANVNYEYHHLLTQTPFPMFNADVMCEQGFMKSPASLNGRIKVKYA